MKNSFEENQEVDEKIITEIKEEIKCVKTDYNSENVFEIHEKKEKGRYLIEFFGGKNHLFYGISALIEFQVNNNYRKEYPKARCITPVYHPMIKENGNVCFYIINKRNFETDCLIFNNKENNSSLLMRICNYFSPKYIIFLSNNLTQFDVKKYEQVKHNFFVKWNPQRREYFSKEISSQIEALFISYFFLKKFQEKKNVCSLSNLPKNLVNMIAIELGYNSFK